MSDVEDYFNDSQTAAKQANYLAQDDDPASAAESVDLSNDTGVPASAIHGDLDGFKRLHKTALGSTIINDNQYIAEYLNSHPLAASVSHDDLGNLDQLSGSLGTIRRGTSFKRWLADTLAPSVGRAVQGMTTPPKSFMEGFGEEPFGSHAFNDKDRPSDIEFAIRNPLVASALAIPATFNEAIGRTISGLLRMGYEGASDVIGEKAARELAAMGEYGMMKGDILDAGRAGPLRLAEAQRGVKERVQTAADEITKDFLETTKGVTPGTIAAVQQANRAMDIVNLYSRAGLEVPPGVHPIIDEALKRDAKEGMDQLDAAVKDAKQSSTGEIAPDFLANYIRQHIGNREIGIDPEAVAKLYGDKVPTKDDGILGWIPDLAEQLQNSKITTADILVPMADWLAHVDPEVHKALHDDIRTADGRPTINETKIDAPSKEVIAEPVQLMRGAAGLEPLAMVGDRSLRIEKKPRPLPLPGMDEPIEYGPEEFRILDENENKVGYISATPFDNNTRLYIDGIGGFEHFGFGPNSFGPALTRSLIRQLKDHYPNLKEISGFRISGAREKAGKIAEKGKAIVQVLPAEDGYLDGKGHQDLKNLLSQNWEEVTKQVQAVFSQDGKGVAANSLMGQLILSEARRLLPHVETDVAHAMEVRGRDALGAFLPNLRQLIVSLEGPVDPLGVLHHEAAHGMEDLYTNKEWVSLQQAVKDEDWIKKFDVERRWAADKDHPGIFEREAIAEAFRKWKAGELKVKSPEVEGMFQRLKAFLDGLREKVLDHLGIERTLTWDEIFKKIDSGEIGAREGGIEFEPAEEAQRMPSDRETMNRAAMEGGHEVEPPEKSDHSLYQKAKDLGITQVHNDRMLRLIEKQHADAIKASERRAEAAGRRKSNKEVKARRTEIRDEVRQNLESRPDIATDAFMSKYNVKFDPAYLTDEQKARLPKDYVQKKNGINPDDIASYFGYTSGDALVERFAMFAEDRKQSGMNPRDYLNRLIDAKTDERLNQEFGDRDQYIKGEARDQAVSENTLNMVHEQTLAYALKNGIKPKLTRQNVKDMVRVAFDEAPVRQYSFEQAMMKAGTIGRKIEEAGSKGDWQEAYRLSQLRQQAMEYAKLVKDYEKARAKFDTKAKSIAKKRINDKVDQEYMNWMHDILLRTGFKLARQTQDLYENIDRRPETTLDKFINAKEAQFMGTRQLDVPDFLRVPDAKTGEPYQKNIDDMSHWEFDGLRQAIDILDKAGRDEKSVMVGGERMDIKDAKEIMRQQLERYFGYSVTKAHPEQLSSPTRFLRDVVYGLTAKETFFNRADLGDPRGIFNTTFNYPLFESANAKSAMLKEIARRLGELTKPNDLEKLVDAPFPDPGTTDGLGKWTGFNKGNVLMMLANAGNKSNWNVLARGYGVDPEVLMDWLHKNVTREDVERAQGLGDIYKWLIGEADKVYERQTGATVEKIPLEPVTFRFKDGTEMTTPGWYYPLDADPVRVSMWKEDPKTGERTRTSTKGRESVYGGPDYFHAATSNGYTKKRTGAIYPLNLDFGFVNTRLRQIAHDINYRETLSDIEKFFGDKMFQEDVAKNYGREYAKGLMPYLKSIAGAEGIHSENLARANNFLEKVRQNTISTYIGANLYTVMKHGPTAWVFSSNEVGKGDFMKAFLALKNPSNDWMDKFIMDNSGEIPRRERHWQDTVAGQGNELEGISNLREKIIEKASMPVAWSDMQSAKPTWWVSYWHWRDAGETHGMSATLADRAVRRAHGSTAEVNLAPFTGSMGPLNRYMTSLYGFFGTAMQRRIELAHKINDTWQLGRQGEIRQAARNGPAILKDFMTYIVAPTVIEELVRGSVTEDKRTLPWYLLSAATYGLSSSELYLRDFISGLSTGHDPGVGLFSSVTNDAAKFTRDIGRGTGAFDKQHAGKTVEDTLTMLGLGTGMVPKAAAHAVRYGVDLATGQQKFPDFNENPVLGASKFARGITHGESERKKH
jgi:Large polyvalent protein associated domain 22